MIYKKDEWSLRNCRAIVEEADKAADEKVLE